MSSNTTHNLLALKIIHIEIIFFTIGTSWNSHLIISIFKTVVKTVSSQQFIHKTSNFYGNILNKSSRNIIKLYNSWLCILIIPIIIIIVFIVTKIIKKYK